MLRPVFASACAFSGVLRGEYFRMEFTRQLLDRIDQSGRGPCDFVAEATTTCPNLTACRPFQPGASAVLRAGSFPIHGRPSEYDVIRLEPDDFFKAHRGQF